MREITVLDVIARECGADFTATLAEYVRLCPEGARLAAGAAEDEELRLVSARVTRTECSLGNPPAHFPVDVLIEGTFAGKTRRKGQFRMRYVLDLRPGRQTVRKPIVTAEKEVPETWLPAMQGVPGDSRLLPDSFGPAVKAILDAKGLTQEELALRLGIDRRNLHRWWGQERASVPHVVGICVALGLRADVALALLQLSGNALRNNPEDNLYRMMLYSAETLDVERCNEILQQAELAPLTRGTFY